MKKKYLFLIARADGYDTVMPMIEGPMPTEALLYPAEDGVLSIVNNFKTNRHAVSNVMRRLRTGYERFKEAGENPYQRYFSERNGALRCQIRTADSDHLLKNLVAYEVKLDDSEVTEDQDGLLHLRTEKIVKAKLPIENQLNLAAQSNFLIDGAYKAKIRAEMVELVSPGVISSQAKALNQLSSAGASSGRAPGNMFVALETKISDILDGLEDAQQDKQRVEEVLAQCEMLKSEVEKMQPLLTKGSADTQRLSDYAQLIEDAYTEAKAMRPKSGNSGLSANNEEPKQPYLTDGRGLSLEFCTTYAPENISAMEAMARHKQNWRILEAASDRLKARGLDSKDAFKLLRDEIDTYRRNDGDLEESKVKEKVSNYLYTVNQEVGNFHP